MKRQSLQLDKILNLEKWQALQDSLAVATKLAIITVDYKGMPITNHSERRPFCKMVRESPELEGYCRKCDSRGGLEAIRLGKPYIYLCHCNIVDMAIPIIVDDIYIGAIMAGQVRLSDDKYALEQILSLPPHNLLQDPDAKHLYDMIPIVTYHEAEIMARLLNDLCHYIVEESTSRDLMVEIDKRVFTSLDLFAEGYSLDAIHSIRKELGNAVTSSHVESSHNKYVCNNTVLKPVFDYMYQNKWERISQKKAASLCYISASHFSRIFIRETGKSFSEFQSRLKVEWAKKMLEDTDLTVTQISEELGFGEPGYFIKIFKKQEAVTPALYRKYYRK